MTIRRCDLCGRALPGAEHAINRDVGVGTLRAAGYRLARGEFGGIEYLEGGTRTYCSDRDGGTSCWDRAMAALDRLALELIPTATPDEAAALRARPGRD